MLVREIMTPVAAGVPPHWRIRKIASQMREAGLDCLPVVEGGRVVGMITEHDLTCRALADADSPGALTARQAMSDGPCCCFDDDEADEAWRRMSMLKSRRLIVVDHADHPVGVLRQGDFARPRDPLPLQSFVETYLDYHSRGAA